MFKLNYDLNHTKFKYTTTSTMALQRTRLVRQAFKNALVPYRYLSQALLVHKPAKPSFTQWNSSLDLNNSSTINSSTSGRTFHYLAEHTLNSNVTYCMNIGYWIIASTDKENLNSRSNGKIINLADIRWPIEKILKERKNMVNRNDRIYAKTLNNPRLDGLDLKEIRYTNIRWPAERILKEKNDTKVQEKEGTH